MKKCECCGKKHNGIYGSGRFCNVACARSFSTKANRKEINKKVSESLRGTGHKKVKIICPICKKIFRVNWNKRHQVTCSRKCNIQNRLKTTNIRESFRLGGLKSAQNQVKRSKNEIYFYELCKQKFKDVKHNENIFNGWDADVIIEDNKIAVLWNGKWQYEKITKKHSVKQVQNRDKIKIKEIKKCGYIPYIIKDMGKHNMNFVEKEFNKFMKLYIQ